MAFQLARHGRTRLAGDDQVYSDEYDFETVIVCWAFARDPNRLREVRNGSINRSKGKLLKDPGIVDQRVSSGYRSRLLWPWHLCQRLAISQALSDSWRRTPTPFG